MSDKATEARRANMEKMRLANAAKAKVKSGAVPQQVPGERAHWNLQFVLPEVVAKTPGANPVRFFATLQAQLQAWLDNGAPGELILNLTLR